MKKSISLTSNFSESSNERKFLEKWKEFIKPKDRTILRNLPNGTDYTELDYDYETRNREYLELQRKKKIQTTRAKNRAARKARKK